MFTVMILVHINKQWLTIKFMNELCNEFERGNWRDFRWDDSIEALTAWCNLCGIKILLCFIFTLHVHRSYTHIYMYIYYSPNYASNICTSIAHLITRQIFYKQQSKLKLNLKTFSSCWYEPSGEKWKLNPFHREVVSPS